MIPLLLAMLGLAGIVLGIFAGRFVKRFASSRQVPSSWAIFRTSATVVGIIMAVASVPLTYAMGYPYAEGRAVGIPFFAAYFDSRGSDYVGPLTYVAAIANMSFWYFFPKLVLAGYALRYPKHHA